MLNEDHFWQRCRRLETSEKIRLLRAEGLRRDIAYFSNLDRLYWLDYLYQSAISLVCEVEFAYRHNKSKTNQKRIFDLFSGWLEDDEVFRNQVLIYFCEKDEIALADYVDLFDRPKSKKSLRIAML